MEYKEKFDEELRVVNLSYYSQRSSQFFSQCGRNIDNQWHKNALFYCSITLHNSVIWLSEWLSSPMTICWRPDIKHWNPFILTYLCVVFAAEFLQFRHVSFNSLGSNPKNQPSKNHPCVSVSMTHGWFHNDSNFLKAKFMTIFPHFENYFFSLALLYIFLVL